MKIKIKKDKFLNKLASKYGTTGKDTEALKDKASSIPKIIGDLTTIPEKLNLVGPIGMTSDKKTAPRENKLHANNGKILLPDSNNSNKQRKSAGI